MLSQSPALPSPSHQQCSAASLTNLGGGNARKAPRPGSFFPSSQWGGIRILGPGRGTGGSLNNRDCCRDWICPEMPHWASLMQQPPLERYGQLAQGGAFQGESSRSSSQRPLKLLLSLAQPRLPASAPGTASTPRAFHFSPRLMEVHSLYRIISRDRTYLWASFNSLFRI